MSNGILVFCEHDAGVFKRSAYELLSKAKELQTVVGGDISAIYIGEADGASLGNYGAGKAFQAAGEGLDINNTGPAVRAIQAAVSAANPTVILASASPQGKDIMPRLSARLRAGLGSEVTSITVNDGQIVGRRPQFAGKVFSDVRVSSECKLFTVRPNSFSVDNPGNAEAAVEKLTVELTDLDRSFSIVGVEASTADVVDLTEADRIVSGGRSVKSKENFDSLIRPLAAVINATPGASRAAVDAGYAKHSEQVGQTGKVVNPSLYIACGISGAIQHLAGMRTSRVIVSINKDKDAPIFAHSTYGIVADMNEVCPVLQKALAGGELPVSKTEAPKQSVATKPPATEKVTAEAPKKLTKPQPSAAKEVVKPAKKATTSPKSVQTAASAPPQAPPVAASVAFDPAVFDGVKDEIKALRDEVSKLRSELNKAVKDSTDQVKKDVQRVEQNARAFQQGGLKRYEDLDGKIVAEVRKVREVLRQGISNDTSDMREGNQSLRSISVAAVVINILALSLLIALLILK